MAPVPRPPMRFIDYTIENKCMFVTRKVYWPQRSLSLIDNLKQFDSAPVMRKLLMTQIMIWPATGVNNQCGLTYVDHAMCMGQQWRKGVQQWSPVEEHTKNYALWTSFIKLIKCLLYRYRTVIWRFRDLSMLYNSKHGNSPGYGNQS